MAKPEQAHHLTYERIYREPLFDLMGACRPCQAGLHRRDKLDKAIEGTEMPDDEDRDFGGYVTEREAVIQRCREVGFTPGTRNGHRFTAKSYPLSGRA